jgi:hypothetical protein
MLFHLEIRFRTSLDKASRDFPTPQLVRIGNLGDRLSRNVNSTAWHRTVYPAKTGNALNEARVVQQAAMIWLRR